MIKRTKILKKILDVKRKLNMPKGTTLRLLCYDGSTNQLVYEITDGFTVWSSQNLDSPYHQRWELGNPHFLVAEVTDRPGFSELDWNTITDIEFAGQLWKYESCEPPNVIEPRFHRIRMKQTGEGA